MRDLPCRTSHAEAMAKCMDSSGSPRGHARGLEREGGKNRDLSHLIVHSGPEPTGDPYLSVGSAQSSASQQRHLDACMPTAACQ
jgi:hypothetical protein